jgi:hypothetical protein
LKIYLNPTIPPNSRVRAIIIAIGIGAADSYNLIKNEPAPQEYRDYAPIDP